jgi:hypothetical protein
LSLTAGCLFDRSGKAAWDARSSTEGLQFSDGTPLSDLDAAPPQDAPSDTRPDSGDSTPGPCGPATCGTGCCEGNVCHPGNLATLCGTGGGACQDCSTNGEVCKAGSCSPCEKSTECAGDTVCLKDPWDAPTGSCVDPWNRKWYLLVVSGAVNCNKDWDLTSDPDPFVNIYIDSTVFYTKTKYDECDPEWTQYVEEKLQKTTSVVLEVKDEDVVGSQLIGKVEYKNGVPINLLKQGKIHYKATNPGEGLKELEVVVRPVP